MKTVVVLTPYITPHQIPWCRELARLVGERNFAYIYTHSIEKEGWKSRQKDSWLMDLNTNQRAAIDLLNNADVLFSGLRDLQLFRKRSLKGLTTIYSAERWFKPPMGMLRLLHPNYARMAFGVMRLWRNDENFHLFPIGVHAVRDFIRLDALMHLDLSTVFGVSKIAFDCCAGGRVGLASGREIPRVRMWGYFVASSATNEEEKCEDGRMKNPALESKNDSTLRLLWCGRLLGLKRVGDIVRAVGEYVGLKRGGILLTIVGDGPEKANLESLVEALGLRDCVRFLLPMPNDKVRELMRMHDIYVLSSNGYEGWGAVVSEAIEEGMDVVGTYEAGSTATILDESELYHAGDYKRLAEILQSWTKGRHRRCGWSAKDAALSLKDYLERVCV